ncbi:MAG: hypothetical protein HY520_02510, partial [Candidatus Aenigmarchaeota archaeon]|nr:hypothetical protein [Candidatus Aenigmarchaeota archaeon]
AARLPEGIVLAADARWERSDRDGEYVGSEASRKVAYGKTWALAACGNESPQLREWFGRLSGDPRYGSSADEVAAEWARAVRTRRYPAIARVCRQAAKDDPAGDLPAFALAAYEPAPGLWRITPFGDLLNEQEEGDMSFPLLVLGVHGGAAKKEVQRLAGGIFDPATLTLGQVSGICYQAIQAAAPEQPGTIPELVVLTRDGVQDYGQRFRAAVAEAQEQVYREMVEGPAPFRLVGDARPPVPVKGWPRIRGLPAEPEPPSAGPGSGG